MAAASLSSRASLARPFTAQRPVRRVRVAATTATTYKVELQHEGKTFNIDVPAGESILSAALDKGLQLPHGAHGVGRRMPSCPPCILLATHTVHCDVPLLNGDYSCVYTLMLILQIASWVCA